MLPLFFGGTPLKLNFAWETRVHFFLLCLCEIYDQIYIHAFSLDILYIDIPILDPRDGLDTHFLDPRNEIEIQKFKGKSNFVNVGSHGCNDYQPA